MNQPIEEIPSNVLRLMAENAGKSAYRLSLDLGRTRNWAINTYGHDPLLSTVAEVADVTGHEVAILDATTQEVVAKVRPPKPKAQGEDA